jgi:hypothetical protein
VRRYIQPVLNTVTLIFLFFILILPNRLSDITLLTFLNFPIELLLLGFVVLLPGRLGLITRVLASVILAAGMILKLLISPHIRFLHAHLIQFLMLTYLLTA